MNNNINYQLKPATKDNLELLESSALSNILDYAKNISESEIQKITNYVKTTVPKQLKDYQIITINNHTVGCLLLEKYQNAILISEIYLIKKYRKKGLGTNILTNILNTNPQVYLWVYKENEIALNLYKKLGFKIKETTATRYFMKYTQSN